MSKSSRDYWREREEEARKHTIADEEEYRKRLAEIYLKMQTNISREIDGFYGRYAAKNGITMDDARKRASKADMEALAIKAKQYVAEKDFSDQANEEMALYNLTMKVNRLELLKAQMGLELLAGYSDAEREIGKDILRTAMKEYERMAGVLGNSVKDAEKYAHVLVNASFQHATFSDRLWNSENQLKNELERILRIGLIQGRNPNAMSPQIEKAFGVGQREALRLVITEMCRVQTEAQKQSYERNGYEEYEFIAEHDERLCDECRDLDGKVFKVRDMQPGHNAPPIHPFCRCSTAPHADRERLDELIRRIEEEREGERQEENKAEKGKEPYSRGAAVNKTKRSSGKLAKRATEIREEMKEYTDNPSKWSGKIRVVSRLNGLANGLKNWNCDITGTSSMSDYVLWHEMLHSSSVSHYDEDVYKNHGIIEEASVEMLTREICREKGIKYGDSYEGYVIILNQICKYLGYNKLTFAKELYNQNLPERYEWIEEKVAAKLLDDNVSVRDYNDVIMYVRNLQGGE